MDTKPNRSAELTDLEIAKRYINKANNAAQRGIEFDLTLMSFRNLMRAKRCAYAGIALTHSKNEKGQTATDLTIDRIDSSRGYVPGNVAAICHAANQLKSNWERPGYPLGLMQIQQMAKRLVTLSEQASVRGMR